jgi:hypothetical protein
MATAPTVEELGPLLGESESLDAEPLDPYADEDGEFMAAARAAVGDETKATALQDAIEACLRKHGLLGAVTDEPEEEIEADELADVGEGFPDF